MYSAKLPNRADNPTARAICMRRNFIPDFSAENLRIRASPLFPSFSSHIITLDFVGLTGVKTDLLFRIPQEYS